MSEAAKPVPQTFPAKAFAAPSATGRLGPLTIQRRRVRPQDVQIEILYCGVCHSDLHQSRDEWHDTMARPIPCVPGHEIVGRVVDSRQRRAQIQGRRHGRRRLHGGFLPHLPQLPRRRRAILRQLPDLHLQLPPTSILGGVTYGGYSEEHRGGRGVCAARARTAWIRRRRAAALRGHHHVLAATPLESRQRAEGRYRRPGRARSHGREAGAAPSARTWCCSPLPQARRPTPCGSARRKWSSRRTQRR